MSSTSEYFNSSATKRNSALKLRFVDNISQKKSGKICTNQFLCLIRPSALTPHVMIPSNLTLPWSPGEMSWTMQSNATGVVEFRGQANNSLLCKRKAEQEE